MLKNATVVYTSWHNQLLDLGGNYFFTWGQVGLDSFFSLNKWKHHLKTAFCIYLHYLCVILKLVWWSVSFKCDKYAKKKNLKQEGGKNLFTALYIYLIKKKTLILCNIMGIIF